MSNKEGTTRGEIESRLSELHRKIVGSVGNPSIVEEAKRDLKELEDAIEKCKDLGVGVSPQNLIPRVDKYFTDLPLHAAGVLPPSLLQFEKDVQSSASKQPQEPKGRGDSTLLNGWGLFNKPEEN